MSLNRDAWKKVLGQPKNLGLKAVGVSKLLDSVAKAEDALERQRSVEHVQHLRDALNDAVKGCEETIGKHRKLYTTACDYLATVVKSAKARVKELGGLEKDLKKVATKKVNLKTRCHDANIALGKTDITIQELRSAYTSFISHVATICNDGAELQRYLPKLLQDRRRTLSDVLDKDSTDVVAQRRQALSAIKSIEDVVDLEW